MGDPAPENGGPCALEALIRDCRTIAIYLLGRTHKSAPCKRGSVNVRFAPNATELLRCRKTSLCANSGLLQRSKTVCEGPSPEKPMHNAQGRPGKCCGGGGYLSTGNPPPKIDEAVFVGYRLNSGC